MTAQDNFAEDLLLLIFNNDATGTWLASVGSGTPIAASSGDDSLYVSLHTASPGENGSQTTNEATYTGYSTSGRQTVARDTTGWLVTTANPPVADNKSAITFSQCTGGTQNITHFGIGTSQSGAGKLLFWGALDSTLTVTTGVIPTFAIGACNVSLD